MLGGAQIIAFAGLIETTGFFQAASTTDGRGPREGQFSMKDSTETGEPGNYGVGFPTFLGKVEDPEARKTKLAAELANGRTCNDGPLVAAWNPARRGFKERWKQETRLEIKRMTPSDCNSWVRAFVCVEFIQGVSPWFASWIISRSLRL